MDVKDLHYYATQDKVYWVVNKDINKHIHANDVVPCIFVERGKEGTLRILQFEEAIKFDNYRYTAWRKFLGDLYDCYVEVLLIHDDRLYSLSGELVEFESLERSNITIDATFLAKFALKEQ